MLIEGVFQMSSYARANVRITNDKNKRQIPIRASRCLKRKNEIYKLKRSIDISRELFSVNTANSVLISLSRVSPGVSLKPAQVT